MVEYTVDEKVGALVTFIIVWVVILCCWIVRFRTKLQPSEDNSNPEDPTPSSNESWDDSAIHEDPYREDGGSG